METLNITPHMLVADVLAYAPGAGSVFIALRMDCMGCVMARFCTLEGAAAQYRLDLAQLMARLQQAIDQQPAPC